MLLEVFLLIYFWHGSCSVYINMFIKRILKIGLVAIVASALTTVQAQVPDKKPDKEKTSKHDKGRTYKKWDSDKVKARLKAAFDQRKKKRGDAKKRGHKVHDPKKGDHKKWGAFGKLVRDDAKVKELKEAFAAASKKGLKGFNRKLWQDVTDDEKKALREKMTVGRKEWYEKMKTHRQEVSKRIKEIRKEFKNNRDKVIDGNDPGE